MFDKQFFSPAFVVKVGTVCVQNIYKIMYGY